MALCMKVLLFMMISACLSYAMRLQDAAFKEGYQAGWNDASQLDVKERYKDEWGFDGDLGRFIKHLLKNEERDKDGFDGKSHFKDEESNNVQNLCVRILNFYRVHYSLPTLTTSTKLEIDAGKLVKGNEKKNAVNIAEFEEEKKLTTKDALEKAILSWFLGICHINNDCDLDGDEKINSLLPIISKDTETMVCDMKVSKEGNKYKYRIAAKYNISPSGYKKNLPSCKRLLSDRDLMEERCRKA